MNQGAPATPAEALRAGRSIARLNSRDKGYVMLLADGTVGAACAVGAIGLGAGYEPAAPTSIYEAPIGRRRTLMLDAPHVSEEEYLAEDGRDRAQVLQHLNDDHKWSAARQAGWLDSTEPAAVR